MEISPMLSQTIARSGMEPLLLLVGALCFVWLAARGFVAARPTVVARVPRVPKFGAIAALRGALAAAAPLAVSSPAEAVVHDELRHQPPWLETSGFPPPRPLVRAEASTHPAVHAGTRRAPGGSLFPRAGLQRRDVDISDRVRRGIIDLRRTERLVERKSGTRGAMQSHYTVMPGDTLWDIASQVLGTDDVRAIARYWPAIHRENRDVVGADPNLIRPGMVLTLPRKERA